MSEYHSEANKKLLEAILNKDWDTVGKVLENFRRFAEHLAQKYELDDPRGTASGAIEHTWTKMSGVKWDTISSPIEYIKKTIHHFMIDQSRRRSRLNAEHHIDLLDSELAKFDESIAPSDDTNGVRAYESGWHGTQVRSASDVEPSREAKHPILRSLMHYLMPRKIDGEIDEFYMDKVFDNEYKETRRRLKMVDRAYRKNNVFVQSLPEKHQERMTKYLRFYSEIDIADEEGVTKQTVSKTVGRYLRLWHWDKEQVKKVRRIWLIAALMDIAKTKDIKKYYQRRHSVTQNEVNAHLNRLYLLVTEDERTRIPFCNISLDDAVYLDELINFLSLWG